MKKVLMITLALGPVMACYAQNISSELDSVMNAYLRVRHFNGSVLVAKGGRILLKKGYGYKNVREKSPNDAQTIYMIASITKQFTAAVILKLVNERKMSLSDSLTSWFPNYPNGNSITIFNLLTHTAGIPDYTQDSTFMVRHSRLKVSEALVEYNKSDFPPGTNWKYSNQGYQLLGEIIQKVSKMSYFAAVRKYIFQPLGMTHSGFDFAGLRSMDKATGYWTYPGPGKIEEASIIDSGRSSSAGAIYSTVDDLYKWNQGLQEYKIIPKPIMDQAYTPYRNQYGFGWFVDSLFGKRILSHSGDTYGFKSNMARVTEDDLCIILLNNIEDEEMRGPLTNDILSAVYGQPYHLPVYYKEITMHEETLRQYIGTYQMTAGFTFTVSLDKDGLWVTPPGQQPSRIYPLRKNYFFSKIVDAQLMFNSDSNGKIVGVTIFQAGRAMAGKKPG